MRREGGREADSTLWLPSPDRSRCRRLRRRRPDACTRGHFAYRYQHRRGDADRRASNSYTQPYATTDGYSRCPSDLVADAGPNVHAAADRHARADSRGDGAGALRRRASRCWRCWPSPEWRARSPTRPRSPSPRTKGQAHPRPHPARRLRSDLALPPPHRPPLCLLPRRHLP